jgi:hypothetical protein
MSACGQFRLICTVDGIAFERLGRYLALSEAQHDGDFWLGDMEEDPNVASSDFHYTIEDIATGAEVYRREAYV